jgi:CubicO group peptidase (beta-lactamase class C family)
MKKTMLALALLFMSVVAHAENGVLPKAASPEDVGLSSTQLKRLEATTKKNIDDGLMPGAVMLVARRGKVAWVSVQGKRAPDSDDPMKFDSIFRIYSMTKPITSLVLMQLVEEGRLQVYDPVAKYLPEIGKMKVGTEVTVDGRPALRLGDPERAMTVQDLLRHTAGLTYASRGTSLVHKAYTDAKIGDRTASNEEMVKRLSGVPLLFTPGERWEYSVSVDVQGRLIEVLTGKTLMEAFTERVFGPLGMVDTSFGGADPDRCAALYTAGLVRDDRMGSAAFGTPRFLSGGGGLVSTAADYHRFTSMLLADGRPLLGTRTLRFMARNHLPGGAELEAFARPVAAFAETAFVGHGFGLGFSVVEDPVAAKIAASPGELAWGGAASTAFWVDRAERITALFFTQLLPSSTYALRPQLRQLVYQALLD